LCAFDLSPAHDGKNSFRLSFSICLSLVLNGT
jgi:hypothetical protein